MVQNNVGSLITNVSSLQQDEINKTTEEPFEWWGPSPAEARKTAEDIRRGSAASGWASLLACTR